MGTNTPSEYSRVTIDASEVEQASSGGEKKSGSTHVRWSVIPLSVLLCAIQAIITVTACNTSGLYPTSTLIAVIGFGFMVMLIMLFNPIVRLVFGGVIAPLGRAELMSIIAALIVTAGVATFGLADQLVPLIPAPWNPEWNTPQRGWDTQLLPYLNKELYITDPDQIHVYREGLRTLADGKTPLSPPKDNASVREWIGFYKTVALNLRWDLWIKPLALWMIFIAGCYAMFFSLAYLVLGYWSGREKLIFPLAKLPEALLPEESDERDGRMLPAIFRSPLFWMGFIFSFSVLAYNTAAIANWIPLPKVGLGMSSSAFKALVAGSFFEGMGATRQMSFLIIFTCIGLAFLLPLEISFSIWFYYLFGRLLMLALYRMGYRDYSSDWLFAHDPVSAQGAGGILVYSAIALWRSIREYITLARGRDSRARLKMLIPLIGLVASLAVLTAWVQWNNVGFIWALLFVLFLALLTIGMMRIVAESGVFWIQAHASFFHFYKMVGMGKVFPPTVLAPLLPIYSVLFLDIKTFIAPNILHAAKMQEDVGGSRLRFHLNIVLSLVVSVVVAISYSIVMAYARGAQQMSKWFYSSGPIWFMEKATWVTSMPAKFEASTSAWFASGAGWVLISMFLRRT